MSIYYPTGCTTVPAYPCNFCPTVELGRIRSIFFVQTGYVFTNISNPVEWTTLICNGQVLIVPLTNGSLASAPKETNAWGNINKVVDSYEYTIEGTDPNILSASSWWNQMKNNYSYTPGWVTQTQIWLADAPAVVIPHTKIDDDMQSRIMMGFTIKWVSANVYTPSPVPVGTFTQCIEC